MLARPQLLRQLPRRSLTGQAADAHAVESAEGTVVILDTCDTVGAQPPGQPLCIGSTGKGTDLYAEPSRLGIDRRQHLQADRGHARGHHVESARGPQRQVNDPILDERTAVNDPYDHLTMILQVGDPHAGVKRQCAVRGHQVIHVVDFAIGRAPAVIRHPVPGSQPLFGPAHGCDCGSRGGPPWRHRQATMTACQQRDGGQQDPSASALATQPQRWGIFRYHEGLETCDRDRPLSLNPHWRWKLAQWRSRMAALGKGRQPPRPKLCPSCGALAGATARRCPSCGANLRYSLAGVTRWLSLLMPEHAPVTSAIFFFCCLLYGLSLLLALRLGVVPVRSSLLTFGGISAPILLRLGARQALLILHGQWWRLISSVFLHASLLHIAMNMWVLMDIGPVVEELYGSGMFLFLFVLTGAVSMAVSSWWSLLTLGGMGLGVGASGALMGLIGLLLAVTSRHHGVEMEMLRGQLLRWVVYIIVLGVIAPGIDTPAHVGGLAAGFLLGWVIPDRQPVTAAERRRSYLLGWLAGLCIAASFAAAALSWRHAF
jgi:membrane associated rhomboid family serine protease